MDIREYIETRVDVQIEWYRKNALACQKKYKISQTIEILLTALIPLFSAYSTDYTWVALAIGGFGAGIAVIKGLTKLNRWQENWLEYSVAGDLLQHQKNLYINGAPPYRADSDKKDSIFVQRIEDIISSENNKWKAINMQIEEPEVSA